MDPQGSTDHVLNGCTSHLVQRILSQNRQAKASRRVILFSRLGILNICKPRNDQWEASARGREAQAWEADKCRGREPKEQPEMLTRLAS